MGLDVATYAENRAIKGAVSALVGDVAHAVLRPEQRQEMIDYLDVKKKVKVGRKHDLLKWCARHSPVICNLYDYGSFVWRRYKAKKVKQGK